MGKKLLIDATHAEETRVVVVDGTKVEDFDFETIHKRQLAGNIYLAKVTRVEPSLQAAFVDYGGNRHGFLAFAEIHPDYYQIPVADRQALLAEERALARDQDEDEPRRSRNGGGNGGGGERRRGGRGRDRDADGSGSVTDMVEPVDADAPDAAADAPADAPAQAEDAGLRPARAVAGMDIVDLDDEGDSSGDGTPSPRPARAEAEEEPEPYRAADHATELDDQIESVADEDISDEVRPARRPRAKRYKIQEVVKVRQIMLVQVVKEERGNKGAALTTYLSLAGRYCVLMPNTGRGGGISRKITNVADRKKLKEIAGEMEVPEGAGLIIRTAGANRTKQEIKRDYEYLFRLWEQIRDLTLKSIAPAPIYEEGDLIKRSIRDLYTKDIEEVLVEGEAGYRAARDFMAMIMPSHARMVKPYAEQMPLFARFQVEGYLAGMFNPTVQLKSGGYLVIGVTEALVAIDINSGKATRQGSIEETALQTNLEAADEIARQLRLRDLAGLIVIDFIDMEERRNNAAVEKRIKDALRNDRARIQVGRISGFGLLEMSRQRLRPGMLEATTQPCPHCHGTGLIRSDNSISLAILRALEEEGVRARSKEVLVRAPIGVVNYLFNAKREHLAQIEVRYDMAIRIEADPSLVSPDYSLEKFKTATRVVRAPTPVVSLDAQTMSGVDEDLVYDDSDEVDTVDEVEVTEAAPAAASRAVEAGENGDGGRKKRRRRRRRRGGEGRDAEGAGSDEANGDDADDGDDEADVAEVAAQPGPEAEAEAAPIRRRRTRGTKAAEAAPVVEAAEASEDDTAKPKSRSRSRGRGRGKAGENEGDAAPAEAVSPKAAQPAPEGGADTPEPVADKPAKPRRSRRKADAAPAPEDATPEVAPDALPEVPVKAPVEVAAEAPPEAGVEAAALALAPALDPAPVVETAAPEPEAASQAAPEATEAEAEFDVPSAEGEAKPRARRLGWWSRKS